MIERERERKFVFLFRICAVKTDRKGTNNKELTVRRGELIEIENNSKKWWRARNFRGEVGHVPHNIVEEIEIEKRPIVCTKKSPFVSLMNDDRRNFICVCSSV